MSKNDRICDCTPSAVTPAARACVYISILRSCNCYISCVLTSRTRAWLQLRHLRVAPVHRRICIVASAQSHLQLQLHLVRGRICICTTSIFACSHCAYLQLLHHVCFDMLCTTFRQISVFGIMDCKYYQISVLDHVGTYRHESRFPELHLQIS